MTYVITQPCIGVKDASCVDVCPVDCIHPSQNEEGFDEAEQLYINPDECIDCGACASPPVRLQPFLRSLQLLRSGGISSKLMRTSSNKLCAWRFCVQ